MNTHFVVTQFSRLIFIAFLGAFAISINAKASQYFKLEQTKPIPSVSSSKIENLSASVILLEANWDEDTVYYFSEDQLIRGSLTQDDNKLIVLSNLPQGFVVQSANLHEKVIYALTSGKENTLVKFDVSSENSQWEIVNQLPFVITRDTSLHIANGMVYILQTNALYSAVLSEGNWKVRSKPPKNYTSNLPLSIGNGHIVFIEKSAQTNSLVTYHTITDKWFILEGFLVKDKVLAGVANKNHFSLLTTQGLVKGEAILTSTKYSNLDHVVVISLVALLIAVGYIFSRKKKTSADYFKGSNNIPWWAASLSIFATNSSAITLMAMPSMAFSSNWIYFSITLFLVCIQVPLFVYVFVPIVRRLNMATANQYLEARFGVSVRMLGFLGFSLNQLLGRMAAILLLPATAISAIFGIPMEYSILIMGLSATIFVTMGGLAAVIWTDVLQAGIMIIAVVICASFAISALEFPLSMTTEILVDREKLKMFDFRLDLAAPVVIVLLLNAFATSLTYIGDQNFVQRVQCTASERESNKAVVSQLFVAMPLNFILFSLGAVLFLYYLSRPEQLPPALSSDGILPYFAAQTLPAGLAGIVVVALLAATISTVSSAMNSVANLCVDDIYRRFKQNVEDQQAVKLGRYITVLLGLFGTGSALVLANLSSLQSLWDLFLMITGMLLAPITGVFMLGVFTKKANIVGAWTGAVASIFANYYAMFHMNVHALVYLVIGVITCVLFGYLVSLFPSKKVNELDGLTIYTLKERM